MKAQESKGTSRLLVAVAVMAAVAALALALWGCAPQATTSMAATGGDAEATEEAAPSMYPDFTDRISGNFNDTFSTTDMLNAGNRGCNACHEDLWDVMNMKDGYKHILTHVGYDKALTYQDCEPCHRGHTALTGPYLGDLIHAAHYGSKVFQEANGNCWSCHVTDTDENGNIIMKLFEDVKYDMRFGGYPNEDETDIHWLERHGWDEGTFSGVVHEADPKLDVQVDQATSAEEDEFNILNFERIEGEDAYDQIEKSVNDGSYRFTVEGVGKPGEYTLDDLKAMPQTEFTAAQYCYVAGYNTAMFDNMPMKGVKLSDFIEAVGGVEAGANTVTPVAVDGWTAIYPDGATDLQSYIDNDAVIVLERYGHDLNIAQGGPVEIFVPGTGGTATVKNLVGIKFSKTDNPPVYSDIAVPSIEAGALINMNTSWFDNDGVQAKVGEPVTLEGASWGWTFGDACNYEVGKILFSLDYGQNWTEVDSPDSFDPYQWTHFTMTWTPEKAGTYIAKAKAVSKNGVEQGKDASIIIQVSE